ncbi:hypothetical protein B0H13DRAFT_2512560 [Mycena leptocephala]|nr:hypothetical protein B0H13DRAFT_2512560 [Mycena leptocephala]
MTPTPVAIVEILSRQMSISKPSPGIIDAKHRADTGPTPCRHQHLSCTGTPTATPPSAICPPSPAHVHSRDRDVDVHAPLVGVDVEPDVVAVNADVRIAGVDVKLGLMFGSHSSGEASSVLSSSSASMTSSSASSSSRLSTNHNLSPRPSPSPNLLPPLPPHMSSSIFEYGAVLMSATASNPSRSPLCSRSLNRPPSRPRVPWYYAWLLVQLWVCVRGAEVYGGAESMRQAKSELSETVTKFQLNNPMNVLKYTSALESNRSRNVP